MSNDDLSKFYASILPRVAELLYGQPNERLSSKTVYRYGSAGSLSVDLLKGVWKDFEGDGGGGVRDLIARKIGGDNRAVSEWLEKNSFPIPNKTQTTQKPIEKLLATYDYKNALGETIYQVLRYEIIDGSKKRKSFKQRRIDENGNIEHNLKGVPRLPYRLVELTEGIAHQKPIFIVEGEKDVETLYKHGIIATTNSGGASNWPAELNGYLTGAHVIILPDNDEAGRKHAQDIASNLKGIAASIKLLELPHIPEKGDVSDYFENGGTVKQFNSYVDTLAIPYSGEEIFRSKFGAIPWYDLDAPGLEHEWLIKNILTRGERSMVAGPSQSGKSFATLEMALAVARGEDFKAMAQVGGEGSFTMKSFKTRRGGVVYQAGEGGRGIKKRLRAYRKHHKLESQNDLPFVLLPKPVDLHSNEEQTKKLIAEINHWASTFDCPLELVVIDTLSAATPGANENSSEDVSKILARCERIAAMTGAHVMFVHHMNAQGEKPRGHTSIFANLDNVLTVRRTEEKEASIDGRTGRDIREIILTKSKDGEDGTIIRFVLQSIHLGEDEDNEPITSCVCTEPKGVSSSGFDQAEKPISLNDKLLLAFRAFTTAVDEFGKQAPENLQLPAYIRVVTKENILTSFSDLTMDGSFENDAAKKFQIINDSLAEALRGLLAKGIIAKVENNFWHTGKYVKGFGYLNNKKRHVLNSYSVEGKNWEDE